MTDQLKMLLGPRRELTSRKRVSEVADQDWLEVDKVDSWLLAKVERGAP